MAEAYPFAAPFSDPYSEVQAAIEQVLANNPDLLKMVAPGNIETDGDGKRIIKHGDAPSWQVRPAPGGGVQLRKSSSACGIVQNYAIGLVTLDNDVKASYFPLKFQVIRAFELATQDGKQNLGLPYVAGFQFADIIDHDATIGQSVGDELQRGMEGWFGIITISVMMLLKNSAIQVATWKGQSNG